MTRGHVPIGPIRAHVAQLRAAGIGTARIAELSGLPLHTVQSIRAGRRSGKEAPQQMVRTRTADRLLAVRPSPALVAGRRLIDATGTRRRLQALAAIGWSRARLAGHTGLRPHTIGHLLTGDVCTLAAARTVHGLFETLWGQAPPTGTGPERQAKARTLADARRRRWVAPMAWDEEAIDDPAARPVLALRHRTTAQDRLDELVWLVESGVSIDDSARRAGYSETDSARSVARRSGHRAHDLMRKVAAA